MTSVIDQLIQTMHKACQNMPHIVNSILG